MDIEIHDETGLVDEAYFETLYRLLQGAAGHEDITEDTEISLTFVNEKKIKTLNKTYRNIDAPTDVLSFPMGEDEAEPGFAEGHVPKMLGDIVISVPYAKHQAKAYGHSLLRELGFLSVHGFLHLCGYDHASREEEEKMFSRQKGILENHGFKR